MAHAVNPKDVLQRLALPLAVGEELLERRALRTAREVAQRHVDVRILTTSSETDVKTTWRAGRAHYEELLGAGVRVYEYQPVMMHAKSLVVDGIWGGVGTMNFDNRSLVFNDESMRCFLNSQTTPQVTIAKTALAANDSKSTLRGASPSTLLIKNSLLWLSLSVSVCAASAKAAP